MSLLAVSQPPLGAPAHETATYVFTVMQAVNLTLLAGAGLRIAVRERTWIPIACLITGVVSFAFEPVLDVLNHIFYPNHTPLIAATILGNSIPIFTLVSYVWWVGMGSYFFMRWLEAGRSSTQVLQVFVAICLFEPIAEYIAVRTGVLHYYGHQPFKLAGYPWYWAFGNTAATLASGYALYLARPWYRGPRGFAIASILPGVVWGAASAATSWPIWLAIGSEVSYPVIWLAGAFSIFLYVSLARLIAWSVGQQHGLAPGGVTASTHPQGLSRLGEPAVKDATAVPA